MVGGCCCAGVWSGCAEGAGTTAGPARRAGDAAAGCGAAGPAPIAPSPPSPPSPPRAPAAAGDCTGVPTLPALVRAIVLAGC